MNICLYWANILMLSTGTFGHGEKGVGEWNASPFGSGKDYLNISFDFAKCINYYVYLVKRTT